jgi:hypothetical protein
VCGSDLDMNADKKLTEYKSVSTKKDKESKKNRFKRMITRPLRRSHSAGCEEDIPVHALFLDSDRHERNDRRRTDNTMAKIKGTTNYLQNIHIQLKIE